MFPSTHLLLIHALSYLASGLWKRRSTRYQTDSGVPDHCLERASLGGGQLGGGAAWGRTHLGEPKWAYGVPSWTYGTGKSSILSKSVRDTAPPMYNIMTYRDWQHIWHVVRSAGKHVGPGGTSPGGHPIGMDNQPNPPGEAPKRRAARVSIASCCGLASVPISCTYLTGFWLLVQLMLVS